MANISALGSSAGIDGEALISQLMAVEKAPIKAVTDANSKLSTKLSTWGRIQSSFSALQDASAALNKKEFWSATTATSSDAAAVSVTTSSNSSPGNYSVQVQALAQAQSLASAPVASKTEPFGSGTLRIELGTFTDNPVAPPAATFAAKAAASAVNIDIGPGDNTLEKIRDKINASNSGVTASLITDASGVRLVLRGVSGAENAFRVTATDADGDSSDATGLSALNYDPSADITTMSATQKAGNAQATINGLAISSASNTLTDVVDGLTIQLNKKTAADTPVELTVAQDNESIKKGIDAFTSAYNSVVGTIRVQTLYDEASKTGGPLQGDSTAISLLAQLRNMAFSSTSASSAFGRLSDIGIDIAKDGTMSTNSTKLTGAMGNLSQLQAFFSGTHDTDAGKVGVSQRFRTLASQVTGSDGAISTRTAGLQGTIKRNEEKIERLEDRTVAVEKRLRAQYTALDVSMSKLNGLSAYVTQQLSLLNKSA